MNDKLSGRINNDELSGQWKQLVGEVKKKWGQLTDDDLKKIAGDTGKLLGMLQEKYGLAKEKAEEELHEFLEENKENLKDISTKAAKTLEGVSSELSDYVKKAPLKSLAMGVGVGIVLSWLMRK